MRKIILDCFVSLLLAITVMSVKAQDTMLNFHINEGKVVWQKTYIGHFELKNMITLMKLSGNFINIDSVNGVIVSNLKPMPADYKGAGYKVGNTSILITGGDVDGFVTIHHSEILTTVTINKVVLIQKEDIAIFKIGERTYLDEMVVNNKGKFKTGYLSSWPDDAKILDYTFNKLFNFLTDSNSIK